MSGLSKDFTSRPGVPFRVVSDKNENLLRRDISTLDKQQTYVLRGLDREQKAFRRSLDSLQTNRSRSGSLSMPPGASLLAVPGHGALPSGLSPTVSRHMAANGLRDPVSQRSISASLQPHHSASPGTSRHIGAVGSRGRSQMGGNSASPSVAHRAYSNAYSALMDSGAGGGTGAAKSWTPSGAWKKTPAHHKLPGERQPEKAASIADMRSSLTETSADGTGPVLTEAAEKLERYEQQRRTTTLPPLVVTPMHGGSDEQAFDRGGSRSNGLAPSGYHHLSGNVSVTIPAHVRHGRYASVTDPVGDGPHNGSAFGRDHDDSGHRRRASEGDDALGINPTFTNRIRIVQSHHLFNDLTTSLPRITTSRPGTAALTVAPDGNNSPTTVVETMDESPDVIDGDEPLISNGFDEGVMGINATGGKSLAKQMEEIKGCRYIRHYGSRGKGGVDHDDAARRIFAD